MARANPDGYTLIFATADIHSLNPHVYPDPTLDVRRDFIPIAEVGYYPMVLFVNPALKASNLKELVALAKQAPGKLTFASWGNGSSSQLAMTMFMNSSSHRANILSRRMTHMGIGVAKRGNYTYIVQRFIDR